jgi:thioredoxin 2
MAGDLIKCPSCGATNRVPREKIVSGKKAICGRCKTPLVETSPIAVTDATFASSVERSPLPVLLDLWAPWCGPCLTIAPVVEELARSYAGRLRVAKLNVDENPQISARFRVQSIPTLLILEDGREIDRLIGAQPRTAIEAAIARALQRQARSA